MRAVLLDAGALVAIDRRDRRVGSMLRVVQEARLPVRTSAAVVAQVWRNGGRQANLARVLAGVEVRSLDGRDGRRAGELLASSGTADVVDAHLTLLARPDDRVLTSDPGDIGRLLVARGVEADVVPV